MKKISILVILLAFSITSFSQDDAVWVTDKHNSEILLSSPDAKIINGYSFFLNAEGLKSKFSEAPKRGYDINKPEVILSFPNSEGGTEYYRIIETPVLHPDLEQKYPGIKSFAGQGINNPANVIRFSYSNQRGFHGMILNAYGSDYFIDPLNLNESKYIVYKKENYSRADLYFECFTDHDIVNQNNNGIKAADDRILRKYRLALSCTAEYGNIFAGNGTHEEKIADILAQMNITMTRVNGVYETDLAITTEIVANNDLIMYYGDVNADPWNGEYNSTTQTVIDAAIGDANYDIGHNFNTSGGGNAGCIGCVCVSGQKGSGMTGSQNPVGDPFDIDYVAHEMGHQFGGWHTMNTCSRSGNGTTEVEPTSASTIMGYAGICPYNIQNNSDAYFAYVNIRDITQNVQSGTSSGCPEIINLGNEPPTADAGGDYTIPISTAFILTGIGTDPNGDMLTYTWEQNDPEQAPGNGPPQSTWVVGPLFRSVEGTVDPSRYFPPLNYVVAGNLSPPYHVIPSVGRSMSFSLVVKDHVAGGGQTADDLMNISVNGNSGPFTVTAPNTATTLYTNVPFNVTWDVANTNVSPVNCSHVNILLSVDGGFTYDYMIEANTPNDGEQEITVPDLIGETTCRIKVEAADNIFYDISDSDFAVDFKVKVDKLSDQNQLNLFPNPAGDILNLDINSPEKINSVKIISVTGSVLKEIRNFKKELNVSNLSAGVYFISVKQGNRIIQQRFIKL